MRLAKASQMQEMDRMTIQEVGIPGVVLMENAARGATRIFLDHFRCSDESRILILCGRGNNGGDGYVMARYLHQKNMRVVVFMLSELGKISGDALINLDIIKKMGLDIKEIPGNEIWAAHNQELTRCDYIIDGILGTGLNSSVKGFYREVIDDVNKAGKPVMAVDIPSGLNADNGQIMGAAVHADLTVTFGLPKLGQILYPGADFVGRLDVVDIGLPRSVIEKTRPEYSLIEPSDFSDLFLEETRDIHKGTRGHLLILAGSRGKTGAAALTANGAIRAGAGLVTVGIPESLNPILENKLTEAMTYPLPETKEGSLSIEAEKEIIRLMEGKTALALGPGLSTNPETAGLVRRIIAECPLPIVIDADGLNNLSEDMTSLSRYKGRAILTPHPGEMSRLTDLKTSDIQSDRIGVAVEFVKEHNCFLVLKGARTLIVESDGIVHVNTTGNRALSSGGTGDVLTGLIGGFLARGWPEEKAAVGGVYLHGLAAEFLAEEMGESGIPAGEMLEVLPFLSAALSNKEWPLKSPPFHEDLYQPL